MRRTLAASMVAVLTVGSGAVRAAADPLPVFSLRLSDDIVFEVDARIELLAGIQSQTIWVRQRGPRGAGSRYFDAISAWFRPHARSSAVKASQALTSSGFTYDAPPGFALCLDGGTAFVPPAEGWSEYQVSRAGGARKLDEFSKALAEAYRETSFADFLALHADDYRRWLAGASLGFDGGAVSSWLEGFYGPDSPPIYHFVLAPAMFPQGGYGFSRTVGEGVSRRLHVYQIVRAPGSPDREPGFPSGRALASLGLHEFGHSFVNPAMEEGADDPRLESIFRPVAAVMRQMAYGQVGVFLNELVLRAACIMAERDLGIRSDTEAALREEQARGFYPIRRVTEILEEYRSDRDRYPSFSIFGPVLLERLASEAAAIVENGAREGYSGTRP